MKEVEKKDTPAISGGYLGPDSVVPVKIPNDDYPANPFTGTGEEDLPIGADR